MVSRASPRPTNTWSPNVGSKQPLLIAMVLALCLAGGAFARAAAEPEAAAAAQAGGASAMEMVVPLKEGSFYVGDVPVRISADQSVEVPVGPFLAAAAKVLRPEVVAKLRATLAGKDSAPLEAFRVGGIGLAFDPLKVELILDAGIDQRARGAVSVLPFADQIASENAARPALVSAYLNTRLGADYVWQSDTGDTGLDTPRVDLEGATRLGRVVIEAEATIEGIRQGALRGSIDDDPRIVRRGTRAVYDLPQEAVRFRAGDIDVLRTSYQHGAGVLGVSVERAYGALQPGRNIRSTGKRSFRVERPSNVAIKIDGIVFKQIRLEAGDYDLADLPLRAGANNITLEIEDDVGSRQVLEFTSFSGMTLLAKGVDEWGATAGLRSTIHDGELTYDSDAPTASGFYRYGLSEELTAGVHAQADTIVTMAGLGAVWGTPYGLVSLEGAASTHADLGMGYAASAGYELTNIVDRNGWRHSLHLGAELWSHAFATAGIDWPSNDRWLELSAHYSRTLPFDITAGLSGRYGFSRVAERPDQYSVAASLHRQFGADLSIGLVLTHQAGNDRSEDNGTSGIVRLAWRPDERSFVDVAHETLDQRSRVRYGRYGGEGVGSWSTDVVLENAAGDGELSASGGLQYVANRSRIAISHHTTGDALYGLKGSRFDGTIRENRSSVLVETAVAFADGRVAFGRPVTNSFAIIDTHETLGGREALVGRGGDRVEVRSDGLGPLLVADVSPYTTTRLRYDVADLPPGYDLGAGAFDLVAPHRSGYSLEVGSAYTVTAFGTLVGSDGAPVALLTGSARPADGDQARTVEVFTNRSGRFSAQGLAPGRWVIEMRGDRAETFVIDVPRGTVGTYDAGTLVAQRS